MGMRRFTCQERAEQSTTLQSNNSDWGRGHRGGAAAPGAPTGHVSSTTVVLSSLPHLAGSQGECLCILFLHKWYFGIRFGTLKHYHCIEN